MRQKLIATLISTLYIVFTCNGQPLPPSSNGDFQGNDTTGCEPLVVSFQSIIPNGVSWHWDFGNGHTSSLENPTEIFLNSGAYTITLDVVYANGDSAQLLKTNYIEVLPTPTPIFSINSYFPCVNTNDLQFQNNTIGGNQYLWDFGDGNLTTDFSPNHHYNASGSFSTTLIATSAQGCSDNFTLNNIDIFDVTQNDFLLSNSNQTCDSSHVFHFSAIPSGMSSYLWEFSNATQAAGQNIQHTFNSYGNFDLLLITEDNNGCVDSTYTNGVVEINNLSNDFIASSLAGCEMRDITFYADAIGASSVVWDFGDGQQGMGLIANHSYQNSGQYTVTMTATNPNGCGQTVTKNNYIEIYTQPSATATILDTLVCSNEPVQFDVVSINAQSTSWMFGDGSTSSLPSVSHTYLNAGLYEAYVLISSLGCTDTITKNIYVSQPNAQFQSPLTQSCAPATVSFVNQTNSTVAWEWNFSNGVTSTDQNPIVTFTNPGNFDAELIAIDINGCRDTTLVIDALTILNTIPSNFQSAHFTGCNPISISFYNYVMGSGYWYWDFGDGNTSNDPMPFHTYTEAGEYAVSLSSVDTLGCNMYIDTFALVTVNTLVIDSLILDLNCNDSEVIYSADCPSCTEWNWNFGDGSVDSVVAPTHVYPDNDLYYISFTGVSSMGCIGSMLYAVDLDSCTAVQIQGSALNPIPESSDSLNGWTSDPTPVAVDPQFTYCGPFTMSLYNPKPNAQSWVWHYGDGDIGYGQQPVHTYDSIGVFSLMLEYAVGNIIDTLYFHNYIEVTGHVNEIVISSVSTCDGLEINLISQNLNLSDYFWSVDNISVINNTPILDTVLTNNNQLHSITLTTNDSSQCSYSASIGIVSNGIAPGFVFNSSICLGDSLIVLHSIPAGYQINWDYGDTSISNQASHIYVNGGTYNISVEVIDSTGCIMNFDVGQVDVIAPMSQFNLLSSTNLCVGDTVHVVAVQDTNQTYIWSFGNSNSISSGATASIIVQTPGTFDIELETGSYGCLSSSIQPAAFVVNQAVTDFSYTQNNYCLPITAQFTDLSNSPVSWNWSFGDGGISSSQNPNHLFTINPNTQITLEVVDVNGCKASVSKNNVDIFNVDITASASFGCAPVAITFTENSQNAIDWSWDFGDGNTSTSQNPTHTYLSDGMYNVSLIVTSADGCIDSIYYTSMIEVDDVVAGFSSSSSNGCAPQPAYFTDTSYNAVSWEWDFGNGFSSSLQNPVQVYYTGGNYSIQLIVESAKGCIDTVMSPSPLSIIGPNSSFSIVDSTVCSYDSVEFLNNSQNAISYMWLFGDGSSSTSILPTYQYGTSGSYNVSLISTDSNGCQNIAMETIHISINQLPGVSFNLSDTIGCNPLQVNANASANSPGIQYQWILNGANVGNSSAYSDVLSTGNHTVSLIVENQGCIDTSGIENIEVHFAYNVQLTSLPPICETQNSVTVNSNTFIGDWYIDGVLNPNNMFDLSGFGPGDYNIVKEISAYCGDSDTVVLHIDSMLTAAINGPLAVCEYDNEFALQSTSNVGYWSGTGITNPYLGLMDPSFSNYGDNTFVYTLANGGCTYVDSIIIRVNEQPNSLFSLVGSNFCEDKNFSVQFPENDSTANYLWYFENENDTIHFTEVNPNPLLSAGEWNISLIVENEGCISSDSVFGVKIFDTIAPNTPPIIRSTVLDESVLTEWENPQYGMEKITDFQIWRSTDSISFSFIDIVGNLENSYLDTEAEVNEQNYYYLIIPSNVCNVTPENNDMSSSILLEKEQIDEEYLKFTWTEYYKWQYGVDYYELQKRDANGNWVTIKEVDSDKISIIIEHP